MARTKGTGKKMDVTSIRAKLAELEAEKKRLLEMEKAARAEAAQAVGEYIMDNLNKLPEELRKAVGKILGEDAGAAAAEKSAEPGQ